MKYTAFNLDTVSKSKHGFKNAKETEAFIQKQIKRGTSSRGDWLIISTRAFDRHLAIIEANFTNTPLLDEHLNGDYAEQKIEFTH